MPEVTWFPDVGFDQTRLQASSKNWDKGCSQFRKSELKTRKIFPYIFLRFPFKNLQFLEEACAKKKYVFVQKPGQKNRALVPSDEGRVRWSSSVRTMFATGNAFEDRNERTWVTVLTGFVWGIMLWRSRCTVLLHLAFFLCLSRTYWPLGPYLFFLHLKGLPCIPLTSFSKYGCSSPGPFKS